MNTELILIVSNLITGVASWFVSRRKQSADTDNQVLKNLELSISIYQDLVSGLKDEIQKLNVKIQHLETKIDELYKENKELKYGRGL
jgi:peptidoglycan hydrolase CwlO-like protein